MPQGKAPDTSIPTSPVQTSQKPLDVTPASSPCPPGTLCLTIPVGGQTTTTFTCTISRCADEPDFSPVWSYEGRVPLTFHYLTLKSTQATISSPSGYQPGTYLLIITDGFQNFPVQVTIPGIPIGPAPAPAPSCGGGVIIFSHSRSTSQQKAALPFDPCSTPAPTPVAEIAHDWNNDGELGTDDNGLVSINQGPPVVGYEPGGTITSAAQSASVPQSYKQQAEVLQTQALPLGYTPAPPYLNISPIA